MIKKNANILYVCVMKNYNIAHKKAHILNDNKNVS